MTQNHPHDFPKTHFSYALTMMPEWRTAIDNALAMLKLGGTLAIVDFHVLGAAQKHEKISHNAFTRWFWPHWFRHDGVYLGPERLNYMLEHTEGSYLRCNRAAVPYLFGLRAPYFLYVGRKPASMQRNDSREAA